jgi:hypothetical protein
MDHSPYEAPKSELQHVRADRSDIRWLTNVLGVLALLPGFFLLLGLPLMWSEVLRQLSASPLQVGAGLATGFASLLGGGLLLAVRPACVAFLGFSFFVGLGGVLAFQTFPSPALGWSAVHFSAFAYAVWLWRRQALRSRPNNSSKPTPLRGAA